MPERRRRQHHRFGSQHRPQRRRPGTTDRDHANQEPNVSQYASANAEITLTAAKAANGIDVQRHPYRANAGTQAAAANNGRWANSVLSPMNSIGERIQNTPAPPSKAARPVDDGRRIAIQKPASSIPRFRPADRHVGRARHNRSVRYNLRPDLRVISEAARAS